MKLATCTVNIGKNGLTPGIFEILENNFKTRENVRICILKSACRDKKEAENWAKQIVGKLGEKYTYKMIGYTIFLKKWRRMPKKR